MKKKIIFLIVVLAAAAGILLAVKFGFGTVGVGAQDMPAMESVNAGQLSLSGIRSDIAYRLVLPDGTTGGWNIRTGDDDCAEIMPLDGGDYAVEICSLDALTVVNEEEDYPLYRYDLATQVPAKQIYASERITVARPEDEGDNVVDLAEGEVLLAPSYDEYAVFAKENNIHDSGFDVTSVTDGPAVRYVSTDGGATWKKLTGDVTVASSAAGPVENGVSYALDCGAATTVITLDNINTTGTIMAAAFCNTVMEIKGDVTLERIDTEQLGSLTVVGADENARLNIAKAVTACSVEIKDLAELNIDTARIAINNMMGDLKLTNIGKMDITVSEELFPSGLTSYEGNVIFTDAFGTVELTNAPDSLAVEVGSGKKIIISNGDAFVYAGANRNSLQAVELQSEGADAGVFPADKVSACLVISAAELPVSE